MKNFRMNINISKSLLSIALFIVLAGGQGLFFLTSVGPLTLPDPDLHVISSYSLATGQVFNSVIKTKDDYGNTIKIQKVVGDNRILTLPATCNMLVSSILTEHQVGGGEQCTLQHQTIKAMKHKTIVLKSKRVNQYYQFIHLPQAIGLKNRTFGNKRCLLCT